MNRFVDRLEQYRQRPIDLVDFDYRPGEPSGAWRVTTERDLIAYPRNTSSWHQDHIILHELGHMINAHRGGCTLSLAEAHQRAPSLAPAAFTHLLTRAMTDSDEYEAELFAVLMTVEATRRQPLPYAPDVAADLTARARRFAAVFGW